MRQDTPSPHEMKSALAEGFDRLAVGDAAGAERQFRVATAETPEEPRAWYGLGTSAMMQDRPVDAIAGYRRALAIVPNYAEAMVNLGMALAVADQIEEAVEILGRLGAKRPESFEVAVNHAIAAKRLGAWEVALASFERAASLRPEDGRLVYEASLLRLGLGDFAGGWRDYEARWTGNDMAPPLLPGVPVWQGENLSGRTILILPEQGLGDMIQFSRYAKVLKSRGARVLIACQKPLVRLLRSMPEIDQVTTDGTDLPPFDYQTMLMSLPLRFGTTRANIPSEIPYLSADPTLVAERRAWLGDRPGFKLGLVWAGGAHSDDPTASAVDKRRSLGLDALAPILELPGLRCISLQYGVGGPELERHGIENPMADVRDFADTAAIVALLDLVITVDTSVAHLAGALGKPVWMISRVDGCWRWLNAGETSPWYPTMRIFRQTDRHDWGHVIADVRRALERRVKPPKRI